MKRNDVLRMVKENKFVFVVIDGKNPKDFFTLIYKNGEALFASSSELNISVIVRQFNNKEDKKTIKDFIKIMDITNEDCKVEGHFYGIPFTNYSEVLKYIENSDIVYKKNTLNFFNKYEQAITESLGIEY